MFMLLKRQKVSDKRKQHATCCMKNKTCLVLFHQTVCYSQHVVPWLKSTHFLPHYL